MDSNLRYFGREAASIYTYTVKLLEDLSLLPWHPLANRRVWCDTHHMARIYRNILYSALEATLHLRYAKTDYFAS